MKQTTIIFLMASLAIGGLSLLHGCATTPASTVPGDISPAPAPYFEGEVK